MLIEDEKRNQLLELLTLDEAELSKVTPLTHALVMARRNGKENLLVFNRRRQYWELAGGMIDAGETPRDCAVRDFGRSQDFRAIQLPFVSSGRLSSSCNPAGFTAKLTLNMARSTRRTLTNRCPRSPTTTSKSVLVGRK